MRVRTFLTFFIDARTSVLNESGRLAYPTVASDRKNRDVSSRVVGHERVFPGLIEADVTRVGPARRDFVQLRQLAGLPVDGEGGHRPRVRVLIFLDFIHRVQKSPTRIDLEKRRILGLRGHSERRKLIRRGIEIESVNSLAAFVCVRANENKISMLGRFLREGHRNQRQEKEKEKQHGLQATEPRNFHVAYQTVFARSAQGVARVQMLIAMSIASLCRGV